MTGKLSNFAVHRCSDLAERSGSMQLLNDKSRLPDHNVLCVKIKLHMVIARELPQLNLGHCTIKIHRKQGDKYMKSATAMRLLLDLLEGIHTMESEQTEINDMYSRICSLIHDEANNNSRDRTKKRKTTPCKPYWNKELSRRWSLMHEAERIYLYHCRKRSRPGTIQLKKSDFRLAQ